MALASAPGEKERGRDRGEQVAEAIIAPLRAGSFTSEEDYLRAIEEMRLSITALSAVDAGMSAGSQELRRINASVADDLVAPFISGNFESEQAYQLAIERMRTTIIELVVSNGKSETTTHDDSTFIETVSIMEKEIARLLGVVSSRDEQLSSVQNKYEELKHRLGDSERRRSELESKLASLVANEAIAKAQGGDGRFGSTMAPRDSPLFKGKRATSPSAKDLLKGMVEKDTPRLLIRAVANSMTSADATIREQQDIPSVEHNQTEPRFETDAMGDAFAFGFEGGRNAADVEEDHMRTMRRKSIKEDIDKVVVQSEQRLMSAVVVSSTRGKDRSFPGNRSDELERQVADLSEACEALVAERENLLAETLDLLEVCKRECEALAEAEGSRVRNEAVDFTTLVVRHWRARRFREFAGIHRAIKKRLALTKAWRKWGRATVQQLVVREVKRRLGTAIADAKHELVDVQSHHSPAARSTRRHKDEDIEVATTTTTTTTTTSGTRTTKPAPVLENPFSHCVREGENLELINK
jgi:hypothetical protein